MTKEIEILIEKYHAQDVGAHLVVHFAGQHIKVADWVEGNKMWVLNPSGESFLAAQNVVDSQPVDDKPKRKGRVAKDSSANPFGTDDFDLGDE